MKRLPALFWCAATTALLIGTHAKAQQAEHYEKLITKHAKANLVPEALVHRVIVRESKYRPDLVGNGGAIGLMQIKLPTAKGLGYKGDAAGLRDPETNLTYGIKYLAGAYRAANGDHDRAVQYFAGGYYYVAKRQRIEHLAEVKSAPVSAPPKELPKSAQEAVAAPVDTATEAKEETKPADAAAKPKAATAKPKRKKLADAKGPVPRPPASVPGGANSANTR